jgi:hypothetical protein
VLSEHELDRPYHACRVRADLKRKIRDEEVVRRAGSARDDLRENEGGSGWTRDALAAPPAANESATVASALRPSRPRFTPVSMRSRSSGAKPPAL